MGDEPVGDEPSHVLAVVLELRPLELQLPAGGLLEREHHQAEGEEARRHHAPAPVPPERIAGARERDGERCEGEDAERVADVPGPPGVGDLRPLDEPGTGDPRHRDRGRDHARDHAAEEQEDHGFPLPLQATPAVALEARHERSTGRGLDARPHADPCGDRDGGSPEPVGEGRVEDVGEEGAHPDARQGQGAVAQHAHERQARRRVDRARIARRDGEEEAEQAERRVAEGHERNEQEGVGTSLQGAHALCRIRSVKRHSALLASCRKVGRPWRGLPVAL